MRPLFFMKGFVMATTDTSAIDKQDKIIIRPPEDMQSKAKPDSGGDQQNAALSQLHSDNPDLIKNNATKK